MKFLLLVLGCFIVYGSAQRVPIGGPGFGDPTPPGGGAFTTLPVQVGGGGANTLPALKGKRDLRGVHPVAHSRTRRSPQRFISGFFLRPFGRPFGRPFPSFFRPQVNPGRPPPNIVGPGGIQGPPPNVVGPGGTQFG